MTKAPKFLILFIILLGVKWAGGQSITCPEEVTKTAITYEDLEGTWIWVKSSGGSPEITETPAKKGYGMTVVFSSDSMYKVDRDGIQVFKDKFIIEKENYLKGGFGLQAVWLRGKDTLFLNDICLDCMGHMFVRKMTNPIDGLKTKKDVEAFIMLHFQDFKTGYTVEDEVFDNENHTSLMRPFSYKGWDRLDMNGDGYSDIIVNGYDKAGESGNILVLFKSDSTFEKVQLPKSINHSGAYYKGSSISGVPVLLVLVAYIYNDSTSSDTLVYKFGNFIEYNASPKMKDIQVLHYYTEPRMMGDNYTAYINFKTSQLSASHRIWSQTVGSAKIEDSTIVSIRNILEYIDFRKIQSNYDCGITDQSTATLSITYNNGKTVLTSDYGQWGTYALQVIYDLLENQNWTSKE